MTDDTDERANEDRLEATDRGRSRRRVLLSTAGILTATAVAGCSGGDGSGDGTATEGGGGGTDTTTTGPGGDGTTDGGGDDGTTADPSTVSFDRRWQEDFEYEQTVSSRNFGAAATPDGVFLGAEWGFAALGLADGNRTWEKDEWNGFVDVHADTDGVVAYTNSFEIVSFAPSDGTERWRTSTTGSDRPAFSTALAPSYFVAESANGIGVYDRSSGDATTEIGVERSPRGIVATDDAVVVFQSGKTVVYDLASGSERWRDDLILGAGAVVYDGRLVGVELGIGPDATNSLTAVALDSGDVAWSKELGSGSFIGSIAMEGGVGTLTSGGIGEKSTVYAHDLADGTRLWSNGVGQVSEPFAAIDSGVVVAPAVTDDNRAKVRAYEAQSGEQLAETDGGLRVVEAAAVDRTYLEIDLSSATAIGF